MMVSGNLFGERFRDVRFALNDHHFVAINHTRKKNIFLSGIQPCCLSG